MNSGGLPTLVLDRRDVFRPYEVEVGEAATEIGGNGDLDTLTWRQIPIGWCELGRSIAARKPV